MQLVSRKTSQKILFGKWNDDGSAICLSAKKEFLTIPVQEADGDTI
jgi:hypothetical protein